MADVRLTDDLCEDCGDHDYDDDDVDQNYDLDDTDMDEEDDSFAADCGVVDNPAQSVYARKQTAPFSILTETAITQRQDVAIANVSAVLSVSSAQASLLLRNFEWSVSKVHEEWYSNEAGVRARVGLPEQLIRVPQRCQDIREIECGICLEYHRVDQMQAADYCNEHFFCLPCWAKYVHISISDGPGCLSLRCPYHGCKTAMDEDFIFSVVSEEDKQKYRRYILRSYVEANRRAKWCPAPGCEYAMELNPDQSNVPDVACACGYGFCWNCSDETHRPVGCATVVKWMIKNTSESENTTWLLVNSKPCPKCKRPIEKNMGCMHMTCTSPCHFEFCWLCLHDWKSHEGSFYSCNQYQVDQKAGKYDESEKIRAKAKRDLDRYTHYYERWASNRRSREKALSNLQQLQATQLKKLVDRYARPPSQLKFITDAWLQIVECRQVLQWTYTYGYYVPENEDAKKQFFEYLQGEAEAGLERLHRCAENAIVDLLEGDVAEETSFLEFCAKLTGLTTVTRNYFQNLIEALENGLADVENSQAETSKNENNKRKAR
ncbi:hypothetical protein GOP47_0020371 [Adiantum capillus-veneris]|uniref:RBR-type E3 ubiquitin transferase n=1 Tax=Adiantum capillus-veneris TaxID=13818 RepID=A0A9D4UCX5_ADICA|nr:hypothetical protein GOP47_0020371 [Adiantum capillus-veneris]